jgi:two-component system sensor histidine kinase YesM
MVPINEELLQIELYISILKLRYGDMFSVVWDISPQIRKYAIVKLSLQPLVENAVYHGIKPKGVNGIIYIRGKMEEDKICFEIADNGVGMSEEECDELRRKMEDKYKSNDSHIGLLNVNQRLKIIFGDECSIEVTSLKGGGTTFYIRIPVVEI